MPAAVSTTKTARSRADQTRIWRRDQRSMNTPANGPISEYGRYRPANAAAPRAGFGNVVALKNTYVPTPAVKTRSPVGEISRVENSRRKSRSASTTRRSETNADRVIQPIRSSAHRASSFSRRNPARYSDPPGEAPTQPTVPHHPDGSTPDPSRPSRVSRAGRLAPPGGRARGGVTGW